MSRKQITNIEVKKNNRNRIFRYMCRNGVLSNPDIAYATKMSLPTVTQMTRELMEQGLVQELGELQSTGGRRAKALAVAANARLAVGLDITRNHVSFVLTNLLGENLKYERIVCPYSHEAAYYQGVCQKLEDFLQEADADRDAVLGMGISYPGIIDLDREMISSSHVLNIKGISFFEISRYFPYPCYFLNDANAGAYGEGISSREESSFFYLSLSNTVGGAFFHNKELEQGKNFRCGEVGHMTILPEGETCYCGKKGCLDVYCSARVLSEQTGGRLEPFFERLSQGEEEFVNFWDTYTNYLAVAVNNIHMVLDCDIVLGGYVGSQIAPYVEKFREKVFDRNTFGENPSFVRVCKDQVGAAALGAALSVVEGFLEEV